MMVRSQTRNLTIASRLRFHHDGVSVELPITGVHCDRLDLNALEGDKRTQEDNFKCLLYT